jgi:hypothetical protein
MLLIDTHAHIYDTQFSDETAAMLERVPVKPCRG